jgi:hypothetical protein
MDPYVSLQGMMCSATVPRAWLAAAGTQEVKVAEAALHLRECPDTHSFRQSHCVYGTIDAAP